MVEHLHAAARSGRGSGRADLWGKVGDGGGALACVVRADGIVREEAPMRVLIRIILEKHSDWQARSFIGNQRAIRGHHLMRIVYEKDAACVVTRPKVLTTYSDVKVMIPAGGR